MSVHPFPAPPNDPPNEPSNEPPSELPNEPPKQPERRRRTIILTNHEPVEIDEAKWRSPSGAPYVWSIKIYVLHNTTKSREGSDDADGATVHAKYRYTNDDEYNRHDQIVRVGHLLTVHEELTNLCAHISAVGDELRERIRNEHHRQQVIYALDECFAARGGSSSKEKLLHHAGGLSNEGHTKK